MPAPMHNAKQLVILDFDGFLINSFHLLSLTFDWFGLDVGDEHRFQNRRKFLKYLGGGKEFVSNIVRFTLPKRRRLREVLTDYYVSVGQVYPPFTDYMNALIRSPDIHVGIVSRNYTLHPGNTIRSVLRNSGIDEPELDFVIPIPVGAKKTVVLEAMFSSRYRSCLLGGDEIGDFRAALQCGYVPFMASYGFDNRARLSMRGEVPPTSIFDTPESVVQAMHGASFAHG